MQESPAKKHIHVYTSKYQDIENDISKEYSDEQDNDDDDMMVPFHVDNGLYLIITPFPNHGLKIKTSTGQEILTELSSDSVLVLMARGLTDWFLVDSLHRSKFHPVPHGVDALNEDTKVRSVFARMKIAPSEAVVVNSEHRKFEDVFFNKDWVETENTICASDVGSEKYRGKKLVQNPNKS